MTLKVKNISQSEVFIPDIYNIAIPVGSERNLTTDFTDATVYDSVNLKDAINNDKVIVKDNTLELNKTNSVNAVTFATKRDIQAITASGFNMHFIIGNNDVKYVEISLNVWTAVRAFAFEGTSLVGSPSSVVIVCKTFNISKPAGSFRIYDYTNGKDICINENINSTEPYIVTLSSFTNLPASQAIWEFHLKSGSQNKIALSSVSIFF